MSSLPVPTEFEEGKVLVAYLRLRRIRFTHIPNETGHSPEAKRRAIRMKQQGTSKGFPDYVILLPNTLLAIELKRQRNSSTTPEQREWVAAFNLIDNCHGTVAKGAKDAIEFIEHHETKTALPEKALDTQPF